VLVNRMGTLRELARADHEVLQLGTRHRGWLSSAEVRATTVPDAGVSPVDAGALRWSSRSLPRPARPQIKPGITQPLPKAGVEVGAPAGSAAIACSRLVTARVVRRGWSARYAFTVVR
jgi:hypothetical protein